MIDCHVHVQVLSNKFQSLLDSVAMRSNETHLEHLNRQGFTNITWTGNGIRRAHLSLMDVSDSRGVMMLHCCVFPSFQSSAPIFGVDIIAGKSKITGCFMDYSPTVDPGHPLISQMGREAARFQWNKKRTLPEWAVPIFSQHIVAAGNISDTVEIEQVHQLADTLLSLYLTEMPESPIMGICSKEAQNFYARQQKLNPQLSNSAIMTAAGLSEQEVTEFINYVLFPEI